MFLLLSVQHSVTCSCCSSLSSDWGSKTTISLWTRTSLTSAQSNLRAAETSVRRPTENLLRKGSNWAAALRLKTKTGNKNTFRHIKLWKSQEPNIRKKKWMKEKWQKRIRAAAEMFRFCLRVFSSRNKRHLGFRIKSKHPHRRRPILWVYRTFIRRWESFFCCWP